MTRALSATSSIATLWWWLLTMPSAKPAFRRTVMATGLTGACLRGSSTGGSMRSRSGTGSVTVPKPLPPRSTVCTSGFRLLIELTRFLAVLDVGDHDALADDHLERVNCTAFGERVYVDTLDPAV